MFLISCFIHRWEYFSYKQNYNYLYFQALVAFVPVGLSSFLCHLRVSKSLLSSDLGSLPLEFYCPGPATQETSTPNKICRRCVETTKDVQELTQLIEWDDGEA